MEERIVSAANKLIFTRYSEEGIELVIPCVRHCDDIFWDIVDSLEHNKSFNDISDGFGKVVEGFITNKRRFIDRKEAWTIAEKQGQIIRDHNLCVGTLYSEHLY